MINAKIKRLKALGKIKSPEATEALVKILNNRNAYINDKKKCKLWGTLICNCEFALGEIKSPKARETLLHLMFKYLEGIKKDEAVQRCSLRHKVSRTGKRA